MDRKKKIRLTVIMPSLFTVVVVGGILSFVLISGAVHAQQGAATASPAAVEGSAGTPPEAAAPGSDATAVAATGCSFPDWMGKKVDEAAIKATDRPYRILKPGDAATMDYSAQRINVEVDTNSVVTAIHCG